MRVLTAATVVVMLIVATPAHTAQAPPAADLRQTLSDIAAHRRPFERTELFDALREGLSSSDPRLRQHALLAIASRSGGPRFGQTNTVNREWREDRSTIAKFRTQVATALVDPSPEVRRAAVLALGNMDFDLDHPENRSLSGHLITDLARVYESDVNGRVRTEVIKAFALSSNDSPDVLKVIYSGLTDSAPGARQFAAKGAGRLRRPKHLEKLVAMLESDRDKNVRLSVAMAVGEFGKAAAPYRARLQRSLAREADANVQNAINRAVNASDKQR